MKPVAKNVEGVLFGLFACVAVTLLTLPAVTVRHDVEAAWAGQSGKKIAVHMAPKPAGDPDGIDAHIVAYFAKAKKTIHGAFYEIREQKFVDALVAARKRKVDVKLLVDNTSYFFRNEDGTLAPRKLNPFVQQLVDAGIEVREDLGRSALMHNKFCVVDGRYVWSGSVNLTDTYATNCNNGVELESLKLSKIYAREFDKKFTKQLFGRNAPSYVSEQSCNVDGVDCEVLFAPEDDPMSRILVLLNSAKKSIHFMQFAFTHQEVTTILLAKFKAGIEVGGIFDHRLYRSTGPYGDFSTLTRAGVPVQLYQGSGLFHHKVFIVDAGTPHGIVITGSQNSSARGNNQNDENVLVMHDQLISNYYLEEYNRRHTESTVVGADAVYDKDPLAGSTLPAMDIMVTSNGVTPRRIKVEYPARWPLDPSQQVGISVWRNGRNVSKQVGVSFYSKGFFINKPGMTPSGPDSLLELHFRNILVPAIPGVYNLYISVADAATPDDFHPCRIQPTINVLPADGGSSTNLSPGPSAPATSERDQSRTISDPAANLDALENDVAVDLSAGKLDTANRFVEQLEALARANADEAKALAGRARTLRRALLAIETDSPLYAPSRELLKRLEGR
jgi:phosphatidylserine/phosphatidylglycerophosphate/cardiolipin synthase-like enzyme